MNSNKSYNTNPVVYTNILKYRYDFTVPAVNPEGPLNIQGLWDCTTMQQIYNRCSDEFLRTRIVFVFLHNAIYYYLFCVCVNNSTSDGRPTCSANWIVSRTGCKWIFESLRTNTPQIEYDVVNDSIYDNNNNNNDDNNT